ncbi:ATP-dependent Clp protease ATP-binding subunit [bacterium]|nr:ATP-dependent Clp protease ATP-binding subunit [bacterium]
MDLEKTLAQKLDMTDDVSGKPVPLNYTHLSKPLLIMLKQIREGNQIKNQARIGLPDIKRALLRNVQKKTGIFGRLSGNDIDAIWNELADYPTEQKLFLDSGDLNDRYFSETGLAAMQLTAKYTGELKLPSLNTPQLIMALASIEDGAFSKVLKAQNVPAPMVVELVRHTFKDNQNASSQSFEPELNRKYFSERVIQIMKHAVHYARKNKLLLIDDQALLWGFVFDGQGFTVNLLRASGISVTTIAKQIGPDDIELQGKSLAPFLSKLGVNLTLKAARGEVEPIVGRKREIDAVIETLLRPTKSNPLLVGEAGVGKTAIVEGLALAIASRQVPAELRGKHVFELPMTSLVSGSKYRGELEERVENILKEIRHYQNIILFIDEVHTLFTAAGGASHDIGIGNMLKTALARGEISLVGATTQREFQQTIETDAALMRRFKMIRIQEPQSTDVLDILRNWKGKCEEKYGLQIHENALQFALNASGQYPIPGNLPDKAIDLITDACVRFAVRNPDRDPDGAYEINDRHVAEVVSEMTGVPMGVLSLSDRERLLEFEEKLKRTIIGQDAIIHQVTERLRTGRFVKDKKRPLGVFLFIGPTGVGKTELARSVALEYFGSEQHLIPVDMNDFHNVHDLSKLVGAAPGFVGYDEEGMLSGALRKNPYSVVLLDEFDKAHSECQHFFLKLFDEGLFTDGHGRRVDARNALFVMTANIQIDEKKPKSLGFKNDETPDEPENDRIRSELKSSFSAEFINRIDLIVQFDHLSEESIRKIAGLQLEQIAAQVEQDYRIRLVFDDAVPGFIVKSSYSLEFGARQVIRWIEEHLKTKISAEIQKDGASRTLTCVIENEEPVFKPSEFNKGEDKQ